MKCLDNLWRPATFILKSLSDICYKSPKKKQVSHTFKHLIANIKSYNVDKI